MLHVSYAKIDHEDWQGAKPALTLFFIRCAAYKTPARITAVAQQVYARCAVHLKANTTHCVTVNAMARQFYAGESAAAFTMILHMISGCTWFSYPYASLHMYPWRGGRNGASSCNTGMQ